MGNHVAIVREGRAGPDVVVADAQTQTAIKKTAMSESVRDHKYKTH